MLYTVHMPFLLFHVSFLSSFPKYRIPPNLNPLSFSSSRQAAAILLALNGQPQERWRMSATRRYRSKVETACARFLYGTSVRQVHTPTNHHIYTHCNKKTFKRVILSFYRWSSVCKVNFCNILNNIRHIFNVFSNLNFIVLYQDKWINYIIYLD